MFVCGMIRLQIDRRVPVAFSFSSNIYVMKIEYKQCILYTQLLPFLAQNGLQLFFKLFVFSFCVCVCVCAVYLIYINNVYIHHDDGADDDAKKSQIFNGSIRICCWCVRCMCVWKRFFLALLACICTCIVTFHRSDEYIRKHTHICDNIIY